MRRPLVLPPTEPDLPWLARLPTRGGVAHGWVIDGEEGASWGSDQLLADGLAEGPWRPMGAWVLGGVAKTGRDGGGGWDPKVPKETEAVDPRREELVVLGCDHVGDQPPTPSKRTPKCLAWMTLCMSRSDGLGGSAAARSACGTIGTSPSRRYCCHAVKTGCNI